MMTTTPVDEMRQLLSTEKQKVVEISGDGSSRDREGTMSANSEKQHRLDAAPNVASVAVDEPNDNLGVPQYPADETPSTRNRHHYHNDTTSSIHSHAAGAGKLDEFLQMPTTTNSTGSVVTRPHSVTIRAIHHPSPDKTTSTVVCVSVNMHFEIIAFCLGSSVRMQRHCKSHPFFYCILQLLDSHGVNRRTLLLVFRLHSSPACRLVVIPNRKRDNT